MDRAGHPLQRLRVTLLSRDATCLYVKHEGQRRTVRCDGAPLSEEVAGTLQCLWPGATLNLLDVREDEKGRLLPTMLVLEPDYLMDISALAECFRDYGCHPLNYLFARLQPSENSAPLLLGNIANLFLDEWIHAEEGCPPDYLICMREAFRTYPIEVAACPDLLDAAKERDFFRQTQLHFEHLRQVVTQTFLHTQPPLDKADAVIEPAYICEPLGLQGRLDYLQRDLSAFIEMKSGKADEFSHPGQTLPKENNWTQMLLYEAVLHYTLGRERASIRSYLLYTRYPMLCPLHTSGGMLRRALDVRNRIVAIEHEVGQSHTPDLTDRYLRQITPDTLNERHRHNRLWERYQAPMIAAWGDRYRALSPLERSYLCTLYAFITREQYLSKCSSLDPEGNRMGAAALWQASLAEKRDIGEILYDLQIAESQAALAKKPYIRLTRPQETEEGIALPNFRPGDAVVLYERNQPGDNVTNRIVFKGTLESIHTDGVCIRLRQTQRNAAVLPLESRYALEHDTMDTTFRAMYQGLSLFMQAPTHRRELLLGQRPPTFDTSLDDAIQAEKEEFRRIALRADACRDYFLLIGPPGTGKTSRALRSMVERLHSQGEDILLLAYTNRAVDEICRSLAAITPAVDFIRLGSELACEACYRPHLIENTLASCRNRNEVRERLLRCHLYVGTVATLSSKADLFRLKRFHTAIVDEATQILEPQLIGLLCTTTPLGECAIGRFFLIGDHKQLPAVVLQEPAQSRVDVPELQAIGLGNLKDSLFERLYRQLHSSPRAESRRAYDMLCRQGRMNEEVASFPNQAFYHGLLQPVGLPHQQGDLTLAPALQSHPWASLLTRRVAFLPTPAEPAGHTFKVNHSEAHTAARLAEALYLQYAQQGDKGFTESTLGIITPYRSQIALIRQALEKTGIEALSRLVTVDTVERYQGSERDVILYSCCLNRSSQLEFFANLTEDEGLPIDRKLNVALTRARRQFFLIGNSELLRQMPLYQALLEHICVNDR